MSVESLVEQAINQVIEGVERAQEGRSVSLPLSIEFDLAIDRNGYLTTQEPCTRVRFSVPVGVKTVYGEPIDPFTRKTVYTNNSG